MTQTAWCHVHENIWPIAKIRSFAAPRHIPGFVVAVTLSCEHETKVVMSVRNLTETQEQVK